jgi:AraC-like DNA-binding protein
MFHFDKYFGLFIGELNDNITHKHYAIQISISVGSKIKLKIKGEKEISNHSFILDSNIDHKLSCTSKQLTLLINPVSTVGYYLKLNVVNGSYIEFNSVLLNQLIKVFLAFENKHTTFRSVCSDVSKILVSYQDECQGEFFLGDKRIADAIRYMNTNFEKVLSVEEVAAECFLSPSRFLHLFKEETNSTFRRYQLWNKLMKSLPFLINNTIIDTAHMFGFSDSSHYTNTFKETFGVTPKFIS